MASERTREPVFHEEDVAEILRRTAQLERTRQARGATLSLGEIERIAHEAGLDPALVRQAAQELGERRAAAGASRWLGAPLRTFIEREFAGELLAEDHEALVSELRQAFGDVQFQQVSAVGRSLSWTGMLASGPVQVHVSPKDGRTLLSVRVSTGQYAGGIFGGLMGGVVGGVGSNVAWMVPRFLQLPWQAGALAFGGVAVAAFWLARLIYARSAGRTHAAANASAERLGRLLEQVLARRRQPGGP